MIFLKNLHMIFKESYFHFIRTPQTSSKGRFAQYLIFAEDCVLDSFEMFILFSVK